MRSGHGSGSLNGVEREITGNRCPPESRVRDVASPPAQHLFSLQRAAGNRATARLLQRELQLRPPGRGEANAYDRRQELVDRLNAQSAAIQYHLDEPSARRAIIRYTVVDESALTNFDRQMRRFIDLVPVLPMRLVDRRAHAGGEQLHFDELEGAYVDVDDLLASTDLSFQLLLIHFLEERSRVRNYERRIGTPMPEFDRAHRAGREREAEHLRSVIGDDTIQFVFDETKPNNNFIIVFRSRAERYRIVHLHRLRGGGVEGGSLFVLMPDGRRLTIEELIAHRRGAAAPAPAPVPGPAPAP
jgi:hypothetical protein